MINASIDIGSNSILLLVARVEKGEIVKVLENHSHVTGLGRNLDEGGVFIPEAQEDSMIVFTNYAKILKNYEVNKLVVTATEASRVAKNAIEFFEEVRLKTNLKVQIITGEAEAYYSTKGILLGSDKSDMIIMDIGGASTELITLKNKELMTSFSMPVGAVRVTNWLEKKIDQEKMEEVFKSYSSELEAIRPTIDLYCVAGTMTSVANMDLENKEFVEEEVHGHRISMSRLTQMEDEYSQYSEQDFLKKFPFLGKRSKTIKAGLILACRIGRLLNVENFEVSTYGLRYGTLIEGEIRNEFIFKQ